MNSEVFLLKRVLKELMNIKEEIRAMRKSFTDVYEQKDK